MIKIICIGKLKERYLIELVNNYKNRINKYYKLEVIELKDSNIINEGKEIEKYLNNNDYIISLDINGKKYNSTEFKDKIVSLFNSSISNITFVIGGSDGIDKNIKEKSNELISFSNMTFPHGLFRGILLEQIYRSFKIINNESYHK